MIDSARKHFPSIPKDVVALQTNQLDACNGHYVDITAEIWDDGIDLLNVVEVTRRAEMTSAPSQVNEQDSSNDDKVTIKVVLPSGEIQTAEISRGMRVEQLVADAMQAFSLTPIEVALSFGVMMDAERSIGSYDIKDGDCINLRFYRPRNRILVKKPVIYLYSPFDIDASIKLSLLPEWSLSVIYPIVTAGDHGHRLEWNVHTHQDGSLTERNSGLDVSYLFWEAETNVQAFPRSPASKPQPVDTFNPISSSLNDMDSIVIPVDKATVYLDKSLKVLGLHTEARTSFITYWLASILKHEYIALRFVPQAAYERAASLRISPQPDVVTRIFMLFKGICKGHLANWVNAQMQAEKDVAWWVDVVGVDPTRAGDATLFRVLEWGGMEVLI
ncbi:hypothetical protein DFJ58DRAFT_124665 [Suillus subalutaceus]|uniref:uncharacterized protein n=1 Tax=Suillus subalutaceus TaxID=48586 RepID=UPI001B863F59|nr:uncharacterized protein DFJ58DRAFT_124665 [Suillus subalutaceus]KAG1838518.1 hypothetical protein DFJ58DRAFT_124665 [Suillus subalutaceus]